MWYFEARLRGASRDPKSHLVTAVEKNDSYPRICVEFRELSPLDSMLTRAKGS
jgi:hypothetical protein